MKMMKLALLVVIILPLEAACPKSPPTTTPPPPCPHRFNRTNEGCFFKGSQERVCWQQAQKKCQEFGRNVHLATLNTEEVSSYQD